MSYYTHVDLEFSDEPPELEALLNQARSYLDAQGAYAVDDVIDVVRELLKNGAADFKGLVSDDIEGLMGHLSTTFPAVTFYVRGMGEEFPDVWLRQFKAGETTYREGPFE